MENSPHFFFAVSLPIETKQQIENACLGLKELLPFKRWVHHEDYHITLAFLGSAPNDKLLLAKEHVKEGLHGQPGFSLKMHSIGTFGKADSPRIFWADTYEDNKLADIRSIVYHACTDAGFELEKRPFRPHITLARKWAGDEPLHKELLEKYNPFKQSSIAFSANEVVLYQTHLDRTPKYERIATFPLSSE